MNRPLKTVAIISLLVLGSFAQIPVSTQIAILKAEDARRYDKTLEDLLKSPDVPIRTHAALAAGRIGDQRAIPALAALLFDQAGMDAAFALGEIESINAADAILPILSRLYDPKAKGRHPSGRVSARLIEAAGKIAAANADDPKAKELGKAILAIANSATEIETIRPSLTALLRARPEGADVVVAKFLQHSVPLVRADAANTLARLRAKNANETLRKILETDRDEIVRANAARALGAAEDKEAVEILIKAATTDTDSRVRVAAIRSLAALKDAKAADPLLAHGDKLLAAYTKAFKPGHYPAEHSEFLEVAVALGRILTNTENERADKLLWDLAKMDKGYSPEIYVARARIGKGNQDSKPPEFTNWRQFRSFAQVIGEFAALEPTSEAGKQMKAEAPNIIRPLAKLYATVDPAKENTLAAPDVLSAFARFKTADLPEVLRTAMSSKDVQIRATSAGLLADLPASKENVDALKAAFTKAVLTDKMENDAQFSILDALYKLDKKESVGMLLVALNAQDYLLRKRAFLMLADKELQTNSPGLPTTLENARKAGKDKVLPYNAAFGTKLGQVLNTDADYRRAAARKNGSVKAVVTTEKGPFTINFLPEDAPLTVDNFIKLARAKYFDGLEVHRVVPNFVMQDGDPRGDGNGGPGWSIRCEVNMVPYERGAVGMALSGKDTGGSQWFVTHSPQPHLDGGYTVFGKVNETDMKVVDNIVRGDKIISVRIVGN